MCALALNLWWHLSGRSFFRHPKYLQRPHGIQLFEIVEQHNTDVLDVGGAAFFCCHDSLYRRLPPIFWVDIHEGSDDTQGDGFMYLCAYVRQQRHPDGQG